MASTQDHTIDPKSRSSQAPGETASMTGMLTASAVPRFSKKRKRHHHRSRTKVIDAQTENSTTGRDGTEEKRSGSKHKYRHMKHQAAAASLEGLQSGSLLHHQTTTPAQGTPDIVDEMTHLPSPPPTIPKYVRFILPSLPTPPLESSLIRLMPLYQPDKMCTQAPVTPRRDDYEGPVKMVPLFQPGKSRRRVRQDCITTDGSHSGAARKGGDSTPHPIALPELSVAPQGRTKKIRKDSGHQTDHAADEGGARQKKRKKRAESYREAEAAGSEAVPTQVMSSNVEAPTQLLYTQPLTPETSPHKPMSTKTSPYFPAASFTRTKSKLKREPTSSTPVPPLSAKNFGLIQELLAPTPFHLLLAVILLNKTSGRAAIPTFYALIDRYPMPSTLAAAETEDVTAIIGHLGLQNSRARTMIALAKVWSANPPSKDRRYRTLHYPDPGAGTSIKPTEVISAEDLDPRTGAFEIAHLPGVGAYALDSWRIFCRDELRGLARGWNGSGAKEGFEPEWKRVRPRDKELRAFLAWLWLREEGRVWDPETGGTIAAGLEALDHPGRGDGFEGGHEDGEFVVDGRSDARIGDNWGVPGPAKPGKSDTVKGGCSSESALDDLDVSSWMSAFEY